MAQIVKISPELKRRIGKILMSKEDDRGWDGVSVVLFESDGILVYKKEYGENIKISYEQLKNKEL